MSLKETAKDLLKVADEIEVEAAEVTNFVCDSCNHTATLAKINEKRKQAAEEAGENVTVSPITVNDKIMCPACDEGAMSYQATEESQRFYIEPETKEAEEEEAKEAGESVDYDSLERYKNG